jgi:hypothetical protein
MSKSANQGCKHLTYKITAIYDFPTGNRYWTVVCENEGCKQRGTLYSDGALTWH